jgi:Ca-activated chloride channel family protein
MLLTLAAAALTGLSGGLLLILLVFGFTSVQAAEPVPGSGQLTLYALDGRPLQQAPLLKTEVEMEVSGMLARVRVVQRFRNPGSSWLEGVYQFPLPPGSAVERLRMVVGERLIEGVIKEKQQAEQVYRAARAAGQRASLLSQQRPNLFTTSVANIAPGETLQVEIGYQQRVRYTDGQFELRFPLVVAPRYIPGIPLASPRTDLAQGWAEDTDQVPDASQITPPLADPADGPLNPVDLTVTLDAGLPLSEIKSHYHPVVKREASAGSVVLRLTEGPVPADRDFLLSWRAEPGMEPRAALFRQRWQEQEYALLLLMPPDQELQAQKLAREIVFVVDNSGSMHGASIAQAKAALRFALSRLGPGDRFNLIHFNDRCHALFPQAQAASVANKQQALGLVERLQAEGGTEMLPALAMALKQGEGSKERLRQIVFLTDGSVGNETALFEQIRRHLGQSRLFTLGIGSAPNSHFMQRAADFGRGSFTYIGDLSEVEARMRRLFEKLEYPAMRNLRLSRSDGAPLAVLPSRLPDLYLGEPLLLALKSSRLDGELIIEGERDGTPWRHRVALAQGAERQGLHRLWARRRIRELMGEAAAETSERRRQVVTTLALRHQLVSPYTSLVALEQTSARPASASLEGGMVPVNLPRGWHAAHVFGRLPQTATPAPLLLLLGLLMLGGGLWLRRRAV